MDEGAAVDYGDGWGVGLGWWCVDDAACEETAGVWDDSLVYCGWLPLYCYGVIGYPLGSALGSWAADLGGCWY